jgi:TRAP-type uncharacterized transport system substrate-binding protein
MGFNDKKITFAGAGPVGAGTPWGTIAEIMVRLLASRGYETEIETRSSMMNNARYVSDGRADIGATHVTQLRGAYEATGDWAPEGRRENLRVLANVNHPSWLAIAVRNESEITDLTQIVAHKIPARIRASSVRMCQLVCAYYGLDNDVIESFGASLRLPSDYPHESADFTTASATGFGRVPWVEDGEFDVIIDTIYVGYTPEVRHFHEAAILHNLRFLPVPAELQPAIEQAGLGRPALLPHKLVRGLFDSVPSVIRLPHAIYTREDAPGEFVSDVVEVVDEGRAAFRSVHLPFSVDPLDVATGYGVPFHPAAVAYYESTGYSH